LLHRPGAHAERASTVPDFDVLAPAHFGFGGCHGLLIFHAGNALAFEQETVLVQKKQTIAPHHLSPIVVQPLPDGIGTTNRDMKIPFYPHYISQKAP
jgi:hypothetical protein